ncbi:hypothetical protein, partial [Klebsiella pneumoniae]|uniref:hypothetical protein n=1 Tax=Klebsiella pneumoniae TaxID=573 RepID=UPI003723F8AA
MGDGTNPFGTPGDPGDDGICAVLGDYCVWNAGGESAKQLFAVPSVVRTGTGDLELLSSADLQVRTRYGIYTAGTQKLLAADNDKYDLPRGRLDSSMDSSRSVLGPTGVSYEAQVNGGLSSVYHAWYPDGGGNLLVAAQGNLTGLSINNSTYQDGNPGNWLWRQG